jgi:transcriptional regulator with XRE-family HTH domain
MVVGQRATHSRLAELLRGRGWTVDELERRIRATGARVDKRTLQRLTRPEPLGRTDMSTIRLICDVLGVGLDDFFRFVPAMPDGQPDEYWQVPEEKARRAEELAARNSAGHLTPEERAELAGLVEEYEALAQHNARVRLWRREPQRFEEAQRRAAG